MKNVTRCSSPVAYALIVAALCCASGTLAPTARGAEPVAAKPADQLVATAADDVQPPDTGVPAVQTDPLADGVLREPSDPGSSDDQDPGADPAPTEDAESDSDHPLDEIFAAGEKDPSAPTGVDETPVADADPSEHPDSGLPSSPAEVVPDPGAIFESWDALAVNVSDATAYAGQPINLQVVLDGDALGLSYNYVWSYEGAWDLWGSSVKDGGDYEQTPYHSWTFDKPGRYDLYVDVMGPDGRTETLRAQVEVLPLAGNERVAVETPAIQGTTLALETALPIPVEGVLYNFVWSYRGSWAEGDWSSTVLETGYHTAQSSWEFTPGKSGWYDLYVDFVYPNGSVSTKHARVDVARPWSASELRASSATVYEGQPVDLQVVLDGDIAGLSYNYVWSYEGAWDLWDSSIKSTGSPEPEPYRRWTFNKPGRYELYADVLAPDGEAQTLSTQLTVLPVAGNETVGLSASAITRGQPLTVTAAPPVPVEGVTYNYVWQRNGSWDTGSWSSTVLETGAPTGDASWDFTPALSGTYDIYVDFHYPDGTVATQHASVEVARPWDITGVAVSRDPFTEGDSITWRPVLTGDTDGLVFNYVWQSNDWATWNSTLRQGFPPTAELSYTAPMTGGYGFYSFYIDATDQCGETVTAASPWIWANGRTTAEAQVGSLTWTANTPTGSSSRIPLATVGGERYLFLPAGADLSSLRLAASTTDGSTPYIYDARTGSFAELDGSEPVDLAGMVAARDTRGRYAVYLKAGSAAAQPVYVMQSSNAASLFLTSSDPVNRGRDYVEASPDHSAKASGSALLLDENGDVLYDGGLSQIKGRGNSTWDFAKKAYQIKLDKSASLVTGEKDEKGKTWVLLANYLDPTILRNSIAFDLALSLGLEATPESRPVDLYYDGEYRGTYLLCEKIQVNGGRVDIADLEEQNTTADGAPTSSHPTAVDANAYGYSYQYVRGIQDPADISGGYLVELDNGYYAGERSWFMTSIGAFVVKSPEDASHRQMAYISEQFQRMINAVSAGGSDLSAIVDVDSLVKSFLVQCLMKDPDYYLFSSTYFYKDAGSDQIYFGPVWDFDQSSGSRPDEDPESATSGFGSAQYAFWFNNPQFRTAAKALYTSSFRDILLNGLLELGTPAQSPEEGVGHTVTSFNDHAAAVEGSAAMNGAVWGLGTQGPESWLRPAPDTYQQGVGYLRQWLTDRALWLDREMNSGRW